VETDRSDGDGAKVTFTCTELSALLLVYDMYNLQHTYSVRATSYCTYGHNIKAIYYVPRLNETIKIINNGMIFVKGEWPGHLHGHVPEQGCTGLDINMLRKGRAIGQAVSCWLPTATARVQTRV
jgi:hypothetical protein